MPASRVRSRSRSCPPAGERDDADVVPLGQRANTACGGESIHLRHAEIHEDQLGRIARDLLDGIRPARAHPNVVSLQTQHVLERLGRIDIVVDNQNAPAMGG